MNNSRIEEIIINSANKLVHHQGVMDSIRYENLAKTIVDCYRMELKPWQQPERKLGLSLLACFDDHGFISKTELELATRSNPDIVLFGGDHSVQTIHLIAEATVGIPKYALCGNHDGSHVREAFDKIGATYMHGQVVQTNEGIIIGGIHGSHKYRENTSGRTLLTQYESLQVAWSMIEQLNAPQCGLHILFSHDKAFAKAYDPALPFNDGTSHVGLIGNTWLLNYHDISNGILPPHYFVHGHLHTNEDNIWPAGQIEKTVYGVKLLQL